MRGYMSGVPLIHRQSVAAQEIRNTSYQGWLLPSFDFNQVKSLIRGARCLNGSENEGAFRLLSAGGIVLVAEHTQSRVKAADLPVRSNNHLR
jgi:hypothetical protein